MVSFFLSNASLSLSNSPQAISSSASNPCLNAALGEEKEVLESLSDGNGVVEAFILLIVGVLILEDLVSVGVM